MDQIPVEIRARIANFVNHGNDARALALVDKSWPKLLQAALWRTLDLDYTSVRHILLVLTGCLEEVQSGPLHFMYNIHKRLYNRPEIKHHVKALTVGDVNEDWASLADILALVGPHIESLHFQQWPLEGEVETEYLVHRLDCMPSFHNLDEIHIDYFEGDCWELLIPLVLRTPNLIRLIIDSNGRDKVLDTSGWPINNKVSELSLVIDNDDQVEPMMHVITKCPHLTDLTIQWMSLADPNGSIPRTYGNLAVMSALKRVSMGVCVKEHVRGHSMALQRIGAFHGIKELILKGSDPVSLSLIVTDRMRC